MGLSTLNTVQNNTKVNEMSEVLLMRGYYSNSFSHLYIIAT